MSAPSSEPTMVAWPPVRGVPPTETAAMASSSMPSPTWLASLEELIATTTRPAMPAHRPLIV